MLNGSTPADGEPIELDLDDVVSGEFVALDERLVVAPSPGRFRREPIAEGAELAAGTVIGRVAFNGGSTLPVPAPVDGVFLGWLAWEGESLQKGALLARMAATRNGTANGAHPSDGPTPGGEHVRP